MNIYDKFNELAAALKINPDVVAFREASLKIQSDETKTRMLEDFRKIQLAAYKESVEAGKVSDETTEKMQNFASIIKTNPDINDYLQAEVRFSILFEDMMKIINDAVGVDVIGTGK
ncbi:YlbF family regulator [Proteiniclasticum sp. BAD-10]|uniref:YlbF family regulator n=1 Tax=Proteiniclasticum sediminis TaxID=2804028 RepID=A0A941CQK3_9CLOT|nr:YlbF family regulator [Proteiniclasticum sediminis]MBR0575538.1 YlbF family regulator [Proteiniclasticum sediminis]